MKIIGILGAVVGFIICLFLLSFILTALIVGGRSDNNEKK